MDRGNFLIATLSTISTLILIKIGSHFYSIYVKMFAHEQQIQKGKNVKTKRDLEINEFVKKYNSEVSNEEIIFITNLSIEELSKKIKNKEISSRKVFLCYAINAATVGKELDNIADCNFEKSLFEAVEADKIINSSINKENLPLLIGVPITIKDHLPVKGYLDTVGLCSYINNVAKNDCALVSKLKSLGAIIICKSNVCQALGSAESTNNIWGHTKNIWDYSRTTGGSSGGEGELISSFCSPIGFGSDIGGSVRIPANFCGIYGFKPTSNRISNKGLCIPGCKTLGAWKIWPGVTGYLSRKYEDIVLLSKILFGSFKEDYLIDSKPFNEEEFNININKKLKIGYFYDFSEYETHVDISNGINEIIQNLNEKTNDKVYNYEVNKLDLNKFSKLFYQGFKMYMNGDGVKNLKSSLKGEYPEYYYNDFLDFMDSSNFKISFIKFILRKFTNEKREADFLDKISKFNTLDEYRKEADEFFVMKNELLNYLKNEKYDGIIMPVFPFPAYKRGNSIMSNATYFYNFIPNICDFPSIAIPIGNIQTNTYSTKYKDKLAEVMIDDISTSKNLPIGIQICSLPGKDEICLKIAGDISKIISLNYNDLSLNNLQSNNFWSLKSKLS